MIKKVFAFALIAVVAGAFASCGGGDKSKGMEKIRGEEDADKVLDDYEYYLDWYEGATDDMIEMGINESQMREKKSLLRMADSDDKLTSEQGKRFEELKDREDKIEEQAREAAEKAMKEAGLD